MNAVEIRMPDFNFNNSEENLHMKKTIKLAVVAAMALGTTSAFATNGDVMIGQGAKSRSMGGVGIAKSFGAESALANPAMITATEDMELTVAATVFMPDVQFKSDAMSAAFAQSPTPLPEPVYASSSSDLSVIPELYFAQRINESFTYGVAVAGTAGMGVDYDDVPFMAVGDNGSFKMKTALQLLKVTVPLSYEVAGVTLGVAPVLQYGTLQMSHMRQNPAPTGPSDAFIKLESDKASDTSIGFEVGAAYDFKGAGVEGLSIGAVYKSKLAMEYKDTISKSIQAFGGAQATGVASGDNLDQPAEFGVGISYDIMNSGNTIAFDYKNIAWGDAAGYKDFGWENQNVFALGYEYAAKTWALRAGYNYAKNPIVEQEASATAGAPGPQANYGGAVKNFFNMAGFPGIVETHFTLGGGYAFTEMFSMDAAFIYAPESSASYDTSAMTSSFMVQGGAPGVPAGDLSSADVKHSQMGITIAGTFKF